MNFHNNHLSYCLNIHPTATLEEVFKALRKNVPAVKKEVCPGDLFGVGFRISAVATADLLQNQQLLDEFKEILLQEDLYIFTINGFPYGKFHNERVKENVYLPDWGSEERVKYTCDLIDLLVEVLPENVAYGSISTVPVCYKKEMPKGAVENIKLVANKLLAAKRKVYLAFEPEPDCYLENSRDCIEFFELLKSELSEEQLEVLGVCLDTCHFALAYEDPAEAYRKLSELGIRVPKIQLSAALKTYRPDLLAEYVESTYLHQTSVKCDENITNYPDLDIALKESSFKEAEWRTHFHVPLYAKELKPGLLSTVDTISPEFIDQSVYKCAGNHLEIETYTFDVLPEKLYNINVSIAKEFEAVFRISKFPQN